MPPSADEVWVTDAGTRLGISNNHPRAAIPTIETAFEKMRVFTGAFAVDMGCQHILDSLPCRGINQGRVATSIFYAFV